MGVRDASQKIKIDIVIVIHQQKEQLSYVTNEKENALENIYI